MTTQEEQWILNILTTELLEAQGELSRVMAARSHYIQLIEEKYNAVFNLTTGRFEPKPEKKEE